MRFALLFASLSVCTGCVHDARWRTSHTSPPKSDVQLVAASTVARTRSIYVKSNGFHTGIVLRRDDVPLAVWPEIGEIADHEWVEAGWGSEIFYRAEKITIPVVLGAIVPNSSVLHVVGFDRDPEELYNEMDLIRLDLTPVELSLICRRIHLTYDRDEAGQVQNLGPGIYADGAFFRARGQYYFPKTCNQWTARCLESAGLPVVPELCGAADAVLMSVRRHGTTIHRRGERKK